jgi:hypothetical protein
MYTKQVSIFVENEKGRFADVTKLLADEGINIRALSLGEMVDFGVLRLIVDDCSRCLQVLKAHDFTVQETDVIAVEIDDRPGGLHRVIEVLDREGINIEYMYAFLEKNDKNAIVVFKVDDPSRAVAILEKSGIPILPEDKIQNL